MDGLSPNPAFLSSSGPNERSSAPSRQAVKRDAAGGGIRKSIVARAIEVVVENASAPNPAVPPAPPGAVGAVPSSKPPVASVPRR